MSRYPHKHRSNGLKAKYWRRVCKESIKLLDEAKDFWHQNSK